MIERVKYYVVNVSTDKVEFETHFSQDAQLMCDRLNIFKKGGRYRIDKCIVKQLKRS